MKLGFFVYYCFNVLTNGIGMTAFLARVGVFLVMVISLVLMSCQKKEDRDTLFSRVDSVTSKINFVNSLPNIKGQLSIVDYLYYYNGGGVSAGDINNDGLTDLYFVSNTGENKLYLNKGEFEFEDVTEKAGVPGYSEWQTGVTMADINGDGWLDIYVCAVADYMGLEGANELFINNGDGTFTERGGEYGLNFSGFSTQASFFDYDHDGDLDMYLLNHAVHTSRSYDKVIARTLPDKSAGDYLFRNDNGKFVDVSSAAGIYQAAMGYGLGICVADIDNDGWEDVYVTNDFHEDDYYYVNNHDGTFTEKGRSAFKHFSRFSMGCDIADLNNDGFQDIMTLDMYPADERIEKTSQADDPWDLYLYKLSFGYHFQFSRNTLQVNNHGKNFSDWSILSGVAATDWSWAVLMNDYNNDGYKDIFITNGIARRPTDLDYLKFSHEDSMLYAPELNTHQIEMAIGRMPEGNVHNFVFEGGKELNFTDRSTSWGMQTASLSNGATYADLDNDGDLDLVTNNINESAGVYRNRSTELTNNNFVTITLTGTGKNTAGIGSKVFIKTNKEFQVQQVSPTRGFLSSVDNRLTFGIGKMQTVDSLIVNWNNGQTQVLTNIKANSSLKINQKDASDRAVPLSLFKSEPAILKEVTSVTPIGYKHQENKYFDFYREGLIPFLVSAEGPKIAVGDVNNDGMEDFFVGGAKHQTASLFIQGKEGFLLSRQKSFSVDSVYEDVDAVFMDVDKDGDLDLYVVSGGNEFFAKMPQQEDRLYVNDGKGNFDRSKAALPEMFENKSCVRPGDFDNDGDIDLFVGGRVSAYHYGRMPRSFLLSNDGTGRFTDVTSEVAPALLRPGMITDAQWIFSEDDHFPDLVIAGDWMSIKSFKNNNGKLEPAETILDNSSPVKNLSGFWQVLQPIDADNDGDTDLVAGNLGNNSKLMKRGEHSILKMFVGDFDNNEQDEQIVAYNLDDDKFYPIASKDALGKQMPSIINKKYLAYKDFAGASIDEIFGDKSLESAGVFSVDQFSTLYLENSGNGKFRAHKLPVEAQLTKVFAIYCDDVDHDGNADILLGGNFSGGSVYQNVYDASYGLMLKGDGKGGFKSVPNNKSGLTLSGEIRDIKKVTTRNGILYFVARNNNSIQVFAE